MSDPIGPELSAVFCGGALVCRWRADWVPAGCVAELRAMDAAGAPLTQGLAITYGEASATITGVVLAEDVELRLKLVVRAPDASDAAVTIHVLDAPVGLTASDWQEGILARWPAVARAAGYSLQIADGAGVVLAPQPRIEPAFGGDPLTAWIAGDTLIDGATYKLRVASTLQGSMSRWSDEVAWTLDKTTPDSARLRALRARLVAAGASPTLDTAIIAEPAISDLFAPLLHAPEGIELSGAATLSSRFDVTVRGSATVFGRATIVTACFRDDGQLSMTLTAPLGAMSLTQMAAAGVVPGSEWPLADWAGALADLTAIELTLDSAASLLRLSGPASAAPWNVLTLADMSIGSVRPDLVVTLGARGRKRFDPGFKTELTLGGAVVPIRLTLPSGMDGWRIALDAPDGYPVSAFSALDAMFPGAVSGLPEGVIALGDVVIDRLSLGFEPNGSIWRFAAGLTLGRGGGWTVINDVLVVDRISAGLTWTLFTGGGGVLSGAVEGVLNGRILVAGQAVEATIDVPVGPRGWRLATGAPITLADARSLASFTGGDGGVIAGALSSLGETRGALSLDLLEVRFHPPPAPSLDALAVSLSATDFGVPGLDWLHVDQALFELEIERPTQADREIEALVSIEARLGESFAVAGQLSRSGQRLDGLLTAQTSENVPTAALAGVLSTDQLEAALPPGLPRSFRLRELSFGYELDDGYLSEAALALDAQLQWEIIPDLLILQEAEFELAMERSAAAEPWTSSGRLSAGVAIGSGTFTGIVVKEQAGWAVSLELNPGDTLNLTALTAVLVGGAVRLPEGFPTITLDDATAAMSLSTLETQATLVTTATWSPTLLNASANMARLGLSLWVGPRGESPDRAYKLTVSGSLSVVGLPSLTATCITGSAGTNTELLATLTSAERQALSLDDAANALVGDRALSSAPAPAGFIIPPFASAGFYADLTEPTVVLYGQLDRLGVAAFVARRLPAPAAGAETRLGVAVLIAVQDFRFSDVLPATAPEDLRAGFAAIDGVLSVESASLVLSSFEMPAGAGNAFAAIERVRAAATLHGVAVPTPPIPAATALEPGLNLAARLKLGNAFWQNVGYVVEARADSAIELAAKFNPVAPQETVFRASLGGFTILGAVVLEEVSLTYQPSTATSLSLGVKGSIGVPTTVPSTEPTSPEAVDETVLRFEGAITVQSASAGAVLTVLGGSRLHHPLGLPGVSFDSLAVLLEYSFTDAQGAPDRRLTRLAVRGAVTVGTATLEGWVLFASRAPQVAMIKLVTPVTIAAMFDEVIGTNWSTDLPELTVSGGALYYARNDLTDSDGKTYTAGLHLDTRFTFWGHVFDLGADVTDKQGLSGFARAPAPIALPWISLTDKKDETAGPRIALTAMKGVDPTFGLEFGIRLFGLRFDDCALGYVNIDGKHGFKGTIAYRGDTPFGKDPALSVTWTEADGFTVNGWKGVTEVLADLDKVFETAGSADTCKALGKFITNTMLKGECKTDVRLKAKPGATIPTALVEIDITYIISVRIGVDTWQPLNESAPKLTVPIVIEQPSSYTAEALAKQVRDIVLSSLAELTRNILNDPIAAGHLAGALAVETLTEQALNALICRRAKNDKLKEEYRYRNNPQPKPDPARPPRPPGPDVAGRALGQLAAASTVVGTAGLEAAAAAFTAADAAAVGALAFLGGLITALLVLFGLESEEAMRARARQEELQRARDALRESLRGRLKIDALTIEHTGPNTAAISCAALGDPARYHFVIEVDGRDGGHARIEIGVAHDCRDNVVPVSDPLIGPGARLVVIAKAMLSLGETWLEGADTTTRKTLADYGPRQLVVEQVGSAVRLTWADGPDMASLWHIHAGAADGDPAIPMHDLTLAGTTHEWLMADAVADRDYAFRVSAEGAPGGVAASAHFTPSASPAPTGVSTFLDAETQRLRVTWGAPATATATRAEFSAADRQLACDIAAGDAAMADFDDIVLGLEGAKVRVGVAAGAGFVWTAWRDLDLRDPGAPTIHDVAYRAPHLIAQWSADATNMQIAARFTVVNDAATRTFDVAATAAGELWRAETTGSLADGDVVTAQARIVTDVIAGRFCDASDAARLTVRNLPARDGLTTKVEADALALTWSAVPSAEQYEVAVIDPTSGAAVLTEIVEATTLRVPAERLHEPATVKIELRVVAERIASASAPATLALGRAEAPSGVEACLKGREIALRWVAAADAESHVIRVCDTQGVALDPQPSVREIPARCEAYVDGSDMADGASFDIRLSSLTTGKFASREVSVPVTTNWLAAPSFSVLYDVATGILTVRFSSPADATEMECDAVGDDGSSLAAPVRSRGGGSPWHIMGMTLDRPARIRLRARSARDIGPWRSSARFDVAEMPVPTDLMVRDDDGQLVCTFVSPGNVPCRYEVEVLDDAGRPLDPPLTTVGNASPIIVTKDRLAADLAYSVRVRTLRDYASTSEAGA